MCADVVMEPSDGGRTPRPHAGPVFPLASILATAHDYLDIDVVFLTHLEDGDEVFLFGDGDTHSFGPITEGATFPLSESYCEMMVKDCLPNVVPDARSHHLTAPLDLTRSAGIGAYIGIPISLSDGSLYGTFCCMSHRSGDCPTAEQLGVMRLLAELAAHEIERHRALDRILVLHMRVARALTASTRVDDTLQQVLAAVGATLGCLSGEIWLAGSGALGLRRRASWSPSPDAAAHAGHDPPEASAVVLRALSSSMVEHEDAARGGDTAAETVLAVPIASDGPPAMGAIELRPAPAGDEVQPALLNVGAQVAELLDDRGNQAEPGPLSPRELQVLELAANGSSVDDAAKVLYLSPATVRTHLRRIYVKLGASNRAAAVAEGMRRNLIG